MEMIKLNPKHFDPDELLLTKSQILQLLRSIKNRWKKNPRGNALSLAAITAFILSMNFIDEKTLSEIWKDIIKATNELITLNEMTRLKGEYPKSQELVDMVIKKIDDGELFA